MNPNEDPETLQKTVEEEVPLSNLETAISNPGIVGLSIVCFLMGIMELWLGGPFMSGVLNTYPTGYTLGFHLVGIPIFFLSGYYFLKLTQGRARKIILGTIGFVGLSLLILEILFGYFSPFNF